jgi:hypothetical protein
VSSEQPQPVPVLSDVLSDRLPPPWRVMAGSEPVRARIVAADQPVAVLVVHPRERVLEAAVWVAAWPAYDRAAARALLRAVLETAEGIGLAAIELNTADALARYEARRGGFVGGLRAMLYRSVQGIAHDSCPSDATPQAMAFDIEELVPGVTVTPHPNKFPLRRLVQSAVSGVGPVIRLDIDPSVGAPLRVLVPDRSDVMTESLALAIDTTVAIRSRFGPDVTQIRVLSFDHSGHGMVTGQVGGIAHMGTSTIHINAGYCCAELAERLLRRREQPDHPQSGKPSARTAAFSALDKVVAHEFGHHLDATFQGSRYRDSIEFRRRLGEALGVATIEMAIQGDRRGASPAAVKARQLLVDQVSAYATTNLAEAMAELFAVWWFSPPDSDPLIRRYGQLVNQYFP